MLPSKLADMNFGWTLAKWTPSPRTLVSRLSVLTQAPRNCPAVEQVGVIFSFPALVTESTIVNRLLLRLWKRRKVALVTCTNFLIPAWVALSLTLGPSLTPRQLTLESRRNRLTFLICSTRPPSPGAVLGRAILRIVTLTRLGVSSRSVLSVGSSCFVTLRC